MYFCAGGGEGRGGMVLVVVVVVVVIVVDDNQDNSDDNDIDVACCGCYVIGYMCNQIIHNISLCLFTTLADLMRNNLLEL